MYNNLSVKELAFLTNKSESTFKLDFKKHYELSPAKYLKIKKLEHAKVLLHTSSLAISSIAYDCWFETPDNFSQCFYDQYDVSPKS